MLSEDNGNLNDGSEKPNFCFNLNFLGFIFFALNSVNRKQMFLHEAKQVLRVRICHHVLAVSTTLKTFLSRSNFSDNTLQLLYLLLFFAVVVVVASSLLTVHILFHTFRCKRQRTVYMTSHDEWFSRVLFPYKQFSLLSETTHRNQDLWGIYINSYSGAALI